MIQVVERLGRLLDSFTAETPELTLTECAEHAGLTKSSAHRLLTSLASVGLVERDGSRWRLGPRVVHLAGVRVGQFELRREALPRIRELGRVFRAAVAFSVPHGTEMVYVERQESPEPFAATAQLGARAPIWAGASGKAVLAQLSVAEREARLDVPEWHRLPKETREALLADVKAAEVRRYAVDPGTFFAGISGVAIAVRDVYGYPVAALSVILPPERLLPEQIEKIGQRLVETADALEASFADWKV